MTQFDIFKDLETDFNNKSRERCVEYLQQLLSFAVGPGNRPLGVRHHPHSIRQADHKMYIRYKGITDDEVGKLFHDFKTTLFEDAGFKLSKPGWDKKKEFYHVNLKQTTVNPETGGELYTIVVPDLLTKLLQAIEANKEKPSTPSGNEVPDST